MKPLVAVLFGGVSPEHEVSLMSAFAVLSHFPTDCYEAIPIGIARDGAWLRYRGPLSRIAEGTWADRPGDTRPVRASFGPEGGLYEVVDGLARRLPLNRVLPVLHGPNGEDGAVAGLCQLLGIPVAGCPMMASALCMDKHRAHELAHSAGVEVPRGIVVHRKSGNAGAVAARVAEELGLPLFVKPLRGGSSLGISKVGDIAALDAALEAAFVYDEAALIEEAVNGIEVGCAILGTPGTGRPLGVSRPDKIECHGTFNDYEGKYGGTPVAVHCPARVDAATEERIRQAAVTVYEALGCAGFARVDLFLTPEGRILLNEVNTMPGMTEHSRFPLMGATLGLDFPQLVRTLVESVPPEGPGCGRYRLQRGSDVWERCIPWDALRQRTRTAPGSS